MHKNIKNMEDENKIYKYRKKDIKKELKLRMYILF
jgi:hypothetical protein